MEVNRRGALTPDGVRFAFATKARAQAKADEMKSAHRQHGDSILNDSVTNHPDVAAALELLKPYQATLVDAARFYVKNSNLIRDPRKVEDVKAELLQSKGEDSRSARYLKDLGQKLSAFVKGGQYQCLAVPKKSPWFCVSLRCTRKQ